MGISGGRFADAFDGESLAVVVDFDGCWRPITAALSEIGIDVSTHGDNISVDLFGNHHNDDD